MDIRGKYLSDSGIQLVIDYLGVHKVKGYFFFYLNKKKESFLLNGLVNPLNEFSSELITIIDWHEYFGNLNAYTIFKAKYDCDNILKPIKFDWFMSYNVNGIKKRSMGKIVFRKFALISKEEIIVKDYTSDQHPINLINSIFENAISHTE